MNTDYNPNKSKVKKKALITGITGQDGSYLAELLLEKNYEVHGIKRRSSSINTARIDHIYQEPSLSSSSFKLYYGDLVDYGNLANIVAKIKPDEIYNLGAQSHVAVSFETPEYTANVDALGTLRLLESIRASGLENSCKLYQASTSELYGLVQEVPQSENTPFYPRSPYGVAKLYSYWIIKNYRESYNMFACNGILFNHESPRRGETFVTRKITIGLCKIAKGFQDCLFLGNLDSKRDWGHAKDYVEMQWLMLQQDKPKDYVIATGNQISVRDFVRLAGKQLGIEISFRGSGVNEIGFVKKVIDPSKGFKFTAGQEIVKVSERYFRPAEVDTLLGDSSLAQKELGWSPKITVEELCSEMIQTDLSRIGG